MRHTDDDDDWDEGDDAWEDEDAEAALVECPKCGCDIYEDAVQCPLCGEYVTHRHSIWADKPVWWRVLGAAGIVAVIAGLTFVFAW
jgi:predicted RNA-binding Zn-ribbon protein involved in translation (DUF1610 family)